jgi:hypothetical protein
MNSRQRRTKRRFWNFILRVKQKKNYTGEWLYADYFSKKHNYSVLFGDNFISVASLKRDHGANYFRLRFYYDLLAPDVSSISFLKEIKPSFKANRIQSFPSYKVLGTNFLLTTGDDWGSFKWINDEEYSYDGPLSISAQEVFESLSEEHRAEFLWHIDILGGNTWQIE